MSYEVTLTLRLDSDQDQERIAKSFESLFEFGTIRESIADGLNLLEDGQFVSTEVKRLPENKATGSEITF